MIEKKYGLATSYSDGLMSKSDKVKLDNMSGGGGAVTGVKGNAESTYRTGDVNLTKENIGLGNVDNTSDAEKPVSTPMQNALNNKVDRVTGKGLSTNDYTTAEKNKLAGIDSGAEANVQSDWNVTDDESDAYIKHKPTKVSDFPNDAQYVTRSEISEFGVSGVKGSAESVYRTGDVSISKANIGLGNVDNTSDSQKPVSTAQQQALDLKVDKVSGKQLSTNDFTTALKTKLDGIETGAEVNQSAFSYVDVNGSSLAADAKKDTLHLQGDNVTLTLDLLNDLLHIGLTSQNVVDALGYTPSAGQNIDYTQVLTSGTEIGRLSINSVVTSIYAPLILALKSAVMSNVENGKTVDALLIKDIFNSIPFRFGIDEDGKYGYYKDGADTVTPFSEGGGGDVISCGDLYHITIPLETSYVAVYPLEDISYATGYERITVTMESV